MLRERLTWLASLLLCLIAAEAARDRTLGTASRNAAVKTADSVQVGADTVSFYAQFTGDAELLPFDAKKIAQLKDGLVASLNLLTDYPTSNIAIDVVEAGDAKFTDTKQVVLDVALKATGSVSVSKLKRGAQQLDSFLRGNAEPLIGSWFKGFFCISDASGACQGPISTPPLPEDDCLMDLCIVLDGSTNIQSTPGTWRIQAAIASSVLASIGQDDSHVLTSQYSGTTRSLLDPTQKRNLKPGQLAASILSKRSINRKSRPSVGVVDCKERLLALQTGYPMKMVLSIQGPPFPADVELLRAEARKAKVAGIEIAVVADYTVDMGLLGDVASSWDKIHVLSSTPGEEEVQQVADKLVGDLCALGECQTRTGEVLAKSADSLEKSAFDITDLERSADGKPTPLIINGMAAKANQFPYVGRIYMENAGQPFKCTGFLIRPNVLMTAAHCIQKDKSGARYDFKQVQLGITNKWCVGSGPVRTEATNIVVHPQFDQCAEALCNDVAFIVLKDPVTTIQPVDLAPQDRTLPMGQSLVVVGWGLTEINAPELSLVLMYTTMFTTRCPKLGESNDRGPFTLPWVPSATHTCLGGGGTLSNACRGDSGGPLLYYQPGKAPIVVGLSSWGWSDCTRESMYTNIMVMDPWIQQQLDGVDARKASLVP